MKKVIWKFPLKITKYQTIQMPHGADCLTVQTQRVYAIDMGGAEDFNHFRDELMVWALVNPDNTLNSHGFHIFGTGHVLEGAEALNFDGRYIGTVQMDALVWHVFWD